MSKKPNILDSLAKKMIVPEQTVPNIHQVLIAIDELEKTSLVKAYLRLLRSIGREP